MNEFNGQQFNGQPYAGQQPFNEQPNVVQIIEGFNPLSFLKVEKRGYERGYPKSDITVTPITSCVHKYVTEQEAARTRAFLEKNGYTDVFGTSVQGTEYFLINGKQRVYFSFEGNIYDSTNQDPNALVVERGQNYILNATHYGFSKDAGKFMFVRK